MRQKLRLFCSTPHQCSCSRQARWSCCFAMALAQMSMPSGPCRPYDLQVEAPPFLQHVATQLQQAGRQLRLLAGLPERVAGDLAPALTESAEAEAAAAVTAVSSDPWAGTSCRRLNPAKPT